MAPAALERLATRVRAAARVDSHIETAQVKLVGLEDVRAAAGARWPRMREHVREGSLRIIAKRLSPDDTVVPCGDGFLVVFAESSAEQTQQRCREISDALVAFYLGDEALRTLKADVQRETVQAAQLTAWMHAQAEPQECKELRTGRFWPVWSARHLAVAAYLCSPTIKDGATTRLGYARDFIDRGAHSERDYLDLDLELLEQAAAAAEESMAPIGVSVHVTTLQARRSRQIYLDQLAEVSAPQRMFITIAEIEPGAPLLSLTEWTALLKQHVPRVAFDLHHSDHALGSLASTGAWAAGYHLPAARLMSKAQAKNALNELDSWCRILRRQGLMPFVNGFQDSGLLDLARMTDLVFATGEKLWPSQAQPTGLQVATRRRKQAPAQSVAA